ncbi:MAG: hypothetical protein GXP33_06115 [Spirochaetes bacterium]|nr:hypothetical protein [Spirochaetota bacterium]
MSKNQKTYVKAKLQYLPAGTIKPRGWLLNQLNILAQGLTGHLEEIWPSVGPDSGWLGGDGENWERGPYYLDGLFPLAEILDNEDLRKRARKWIRRTLDNRSKEGFFGPESNPDWWPRTVMLKVLIQYIEVSDDKQALTLIEDFFRYMDSMLDERPLQMWAYARGYEGLVSLLWLTEKKHSELLLKIAERIASLSMKWEIFFKDFPYTKPAGYYLNWQYYQEKINTIISADKNQPTAISEEKYIELLGEEKYRELFALYHQTHGVNIAMALKYPAYAYQLTGNMEYLDAVRKGYHNLLKYHGQATGVYSCDEHLNGKEPFQGTELCTVVEMMFSFEEIIRVTGDLSWGDTLEEIAYNALPAPVAADGCSHQYNQQVNQIICSVAPRQWYNNGDDSNIFGLEPNFGCCTANMHQGWPKLVRSSWMVEKGKNKEPDTLVFVTYAALSAEIRLSGTGVKVTMDTDYPFNGRIILTMQADTDVRFNIKFRIPRWAEDYVLEIKDEGAGRITRTITNRGKVLILKGLSGSEKIEIRFPMEPRLERTGKGCVIKRGPLLFALPLKCQKKELTARGRFSDWELYPESEWRYALLPDSIEDCEVSYIPVRCGGFKSSPPPVALKVRGIKIGNWDIENNSAGKIPSEPVPADSQKNAGPVFLTLIPYGCTDLRIALFPLLK